VTTSDPPIVGHFRERIAAYDAVPLEERDSGIVTVVCGDNLTVALGVELREVATCFDGVGIYVVTAEQARRVLEAWGEVAAARDAELAVDAD